MVHHRLSGLWLFPGGKVEEGETFDAAVEREFLEETGLRVAADRDTSLRIYLGDERSPTQAAPFFCDLHQIHDGSYHLGMYYLVRLLEPPALEQTSFPSADAGVLECRWAALEELQELRTDERIRAVAQAAMRGSTLTP